MVCEFAPPFQRFMHGATSAWWSYRGPGERVSSGLQQQMDMVGHQDVGMEGDAISAAIALEALEIAGVIFGIMKDRRPLVATDDHMIESARKIDARLASHGGESMEYDPVNTHA